MLILFTALKYGLRNKPLWRNWQTHTTQNRTGNHMGSSPISGIKGEIYSKKSAFWKEGFFCFKEFVQLQLNYLDWDSEGVQSRKCYETAVKHGKPVIVMEPVKGGTLARVPESVEKIFRECHPEMSIPSWAIRFAASQDYVMMVLSGMSNMEQLTDNMSYMSDFQPLNEKEQALVKKAVDIINSNIAVPCTGCSYCTEGCPQHIAIPKYFSLYNADMQEIKEKAWRPQGEYYDRLTLTFGKASDCLECGQCEQACPQHLPIIQYLKDVAARFETQS